MTISYSEHSQLICPNCNYEFSAEVWLILDAREQPAEVERLRQGELNIVACPQCGQSGSAGAPLLFHDRQARQVIFAASPGVEEHEWREQARDLHFLLVGSIPEEDRRSYLSDVQVAQDVPGIGRILAKAERYAAAARQHPSADAGQAPPAEPESASPAASESASASPLLTAVQALLAAASDADIQAAVVAHPILLAPDSDLALGQLADTAVEQREYEIAEGLQRARQLLNQLRTADSDAKTKGPSPVATAAPDPQPDATANPMDLPDHIVQALLRTQTERELDAVIQQFPILLDPWVDTVLTVWVDQALDEDNERLAAQLEERREALAHMRVARRSSEANAHDLNLREALEALLSSEDEDEIARTLHMYPVLLTDSAQQALRQVASEAQSIGDEEMATYAVECREMLHRVRGELEP